MSLDPELAALFTRTVTLEAFSSTDTYGARTYGAAMSVKARIEQFAKKVTDAQGREVVSNSRLFLLPADTTGAAIAPTPKDRVTLPAGYEPQAPPIISVHVEDDDEGINHFVLNV